MTISIGRSAYQANQLIPDSKGVVKTIKRSNASVQDIMKGIIMADQEAWEDTMEFSETFDFNKLSDFERLWSIVRHDIKYKIDVPGFEVIKSPSATWWSGYADCKSKSLFTGSVMNNGGLKYFYRFVHYGNENAGHVYVVAASEVFGEVILDSVHTRFNEELPYAFKLDYDPSTGRTFNQVGKISNTNFWKILLGGFLVYKIFFN